MYRKYKRIHVVVLDSVGCGEAPDASAYGDQGANTLGHILATTKIALPNLEQMGLGVLGDFPPLEKVVPSVGYVGRLQEESKGKDTMTGHWELMGLKTTEAFPLWPEGFPAPLIEKIEKYSQRQVICNLPYSGTQVLQDYGKQQLESGALIVYTSGDPVLQIAAHEEKILLEELYDICHYVRGITQTPPYLLGRIIARPYVGKPGSFTRTANRHDYALSPHRVTTLDLLKKAGYEVHAIGKIADIFNGSGITKSTSTQNNQDGINKLLEVAKAEFTGISFLNLVDFDALFGHRRDPFGYARALQEFDARIPEIKKALRPDDLLVITADHGNDPTFMGTDHTREQVPLLLYSPSMTEGKRLADGVFSDVSRLIRRNFEIETNNR